MRIEKGEKINKLKEYLEKEKDIILAFLFGSYAKDREVSESDVDIGIYTAIKWNLKKFIRSGINWRKYLGKMLT